MSRLTLYFCFLLVASTSLYSQRGDYQYSQSDSAFLQSNLNWTEIGGVRATRFLEKDSLGFVWFYSKNGLARYDGVDYKTYNHNSDRLNSISNGEVRCVAFNEAEHSIWLGYKNQGLHKFDLLTESSISYQKDLSDSNSLSDNGVTALLKDESSNLWVITKDNVLHLLDEEKGLFKKFNIPKPTSYKSKGIDRDPGGIIQDVRKDNILWIASKFGLYKFDKDNESFTHYDIDKYVESFYYQFQTPIYQDPDGLIWYGHFRNEGVKVFDPSIEEWVHRISTSADISSFTFDIKPYGDSLILASLRPAHLMVINRFDPKRHWIIDYEAPTNSSELLVDKELNIYTTSGLASLTKAYRSKQLFQFVNFESNTGMQDFWPYAIAYDDTKHQYFVGDRSGRGLCITNNDYEVIDLVSFEPYAPARINDIYHNPTTQRTWMAAKNGIYYHDRGSNEFVIIENGDYTNFPFSKIKSHGDMLFFINNDVVVRIDQRNLIVRKLPFQNPYNPTQHILSAEPIDTSQVLIGSTDGPWIGSMDSQKTERLFDLSNEASNVLTKLIVRDILVEDDVVYFGTENNGIFEAELGSDGVTNVRNHYNSLSPEANNVHSMKHRGDKLWTSGKNGVQFLDLSNKEFINFDYKDGIQYSWRKFAFYEGANDEFIMPFDNSYYQFKPDDVNIQTMGPFLNTVTVNGEVVAKDSNSGEYNQQNFESDQRNFYLEFGALNFDAQSKNFYRYRLLGQDSTWNFLGNENKINLVNIPPGDYELQYEVKSLHSYWAGNKFKFHIKKPLLLRWYFLMLWGFLILALLWSAYKLILSRQERKRRILYLQKEKLEAELVSFKAQMNPHFLFNTLNSINWYILKNDPKKSSKYLTKFSRVMRDILENSKENLIPLARELASLKLFVEIESMRFDNKFEYTVEIGGDIDANNCHVPPLILQPFVENAIWHGLLRKRDKGHLTLRLSREEKQLKCLIEDDGIGRDAMSQSNSTSMGIELANKRILAIENAVARPIRIIDLKNDDGTPSGTRIEILIPFIN